MTSLGKFKKPFDIQPKFDLKDNRVRVERDTCT